MDITQYDAVTFDCYGTLIDWDTGVSNFFGPWAVRNGVAASCVDLVADFAKAQRANQQKTPFLNYRDVIREAFRDTAEMAGAEPTEADLDAFAASVGSWPAFPDTIDALRSLKSAGLHLGVLSNVDNASFEETLRRLGNLVDTVVTAETVQTYKPDLTMFESLFAALGKAGIDRTRVLHVAQSRFHDVAPGLEIGLDVVWIDRRHGRPGQGVTVESDAQPRWRYENLAGFCDAALSERA